MCGQLITSARLYIPSFIKIRSGVSEPQGVKIWPFPLLWLVAFTTACTTVQAVIFHEVQCQKLSKASPWSSISDNLTTTRSICVVHDPP